MASQGPRVVTVISGGYCLGVPSSDQFAHQETPKTWMSMRLTMASFDLLRLTQKKIHGLRCFKMRWFHLDTKHEKTYAHLYTTSSFKEQWLDRNVSAALRNDAPRIREEGLHIRQPCAAEAPNMAMSSTLSKFMAHFCIWKSESHFWDDSHMFQLYQQSNICSNIQHVWRGQLWGKCHYVSLWPFGKRPGLALNIWGIEMERKPIIGLKWYIMI